MPGTKELSQAYMLLFFLSLIPHSAFSLHLEYFFPHGKQSLNICKINDCESMIESMVNMRIRERPI